MVLLLKQRPGSSSKKSRLEKKRIAQKRMLISAVRKGGKNKLKIRLLLQYECKEQGVIERLAVSN